MTSDKPMRILAVDDDHGILELLQAYTEMQGIELTEATDVNSALLALNKHPVDAIVCDMRLGGQTGMDLYQATRNRFGNLPFVLITGFTLDEVNRAKKGTGPKVFFKPFDIMDLLNYLKEVLGKA